MLMLLMLLECKQEPKSGKKKLFLDFSLLSVLLWFVPHESNDVNDYFLYARLFKYIFINLSFQLCKFQIIFHVCVVQYFASNHARPLTRHQIYIHIVAVWEVVEPTYIPIYVHIYTQCMYVYITYVWTIPDYI